MSTAPYWTPLDDAELGVVVDALAGAALAHRACAACKRLGTAWCPPMREAAEAVLDWRRTRALRSRLAWLRELQENGDEP